MSKYQLEPCPFCGAELSIIESLDKVFKGYVSSRIECNDCWYAMYSSSYRLKEKGTKERVVADLVKRWNRRYYNDRY